MRNRFQAILDAQLALKGLSLSAAVQRTGALEGADVDEGPGVEGAWALAGDLEQHRERASVTRTP